MCLNYSNEDAHRAVFCVLALTALVCRFSKTESQKHSTPLHTTTYLAKDTIEPIQYHT